MRAIERIRPIHKATIFPCDAPATASTLSSDIDTSAITIK